MVLVGGMRGALDADPANPRLPFTAPNYDGNMNAYPGPPRSLLLSLLCGMRLAIAGEPPVFIQHPLAVMVPVGEMLRLSCWAIGISPIS